MGVGEGSAGSAAGRDGYCLNCCIAIPVCITICGFLGVVNTGQQISGGNLAICAGDIGANQVAAGSIGVQLDLPTGEICAGVGLLHKLNPAVMSVREGNGSCLICNHVHRFNRSVTAPVGITACGFLGVVDALVQCDGNGTIDTCFVGAYQGAAGSIGVQLDLPAGKTGASVGNLFQHSGAGAAAVFNVQPHNAIGSSFVQNDSPGLTTGGVAWRGHGLYNGIHTKRNRCFIGRNGIAFDVCGANGECFAALNVGGFKFGTSQGCTIGICLVYLNSAGVVLRPGNVVVLG